MISIDLQSLTSLGSQQKSYGIIEIEPISVSAIAVSAMIAIMSGCDCFGSDHIETSDY